MFTIRKDRPKSHAQASGFSSWPSGMNSNLSSRPKDMAERPAPGGGMNADVLSDVLRAVRLSGAVYFDFELSSPWIVEAPPSREIVGKVMPGAQRVIEFHLIARGTCWGHAIGDEPMRLREGDLIVFPQGDAHVLSSMPGMRAVPDMEAFARASTPLPMFYELGGGGPERARIVCCFLGCDERPFNPLLSALPAVIHLSSAAEGASAGWLGTLLSMAAQESASARSGGQNVLARLSELMFVETVRRYLETLPLAETGWLAGLRDPMVSHALTVLHRAPQESWTVERVARVVGVSRSVLAERFTLMLGQPPMQYLALWRMQLASRLLLEGDSVTTVAAAVGYESESAFSRTFKRLVGQTPATWWRRSQSRCGL
jgi:AraC-like DNA-binding protein